MSLHRLNKLIVFKQCAQSKWRIIFSCSCLLPLFQRFTTFLDRSYASDVKKTSLHSFHMRNGGKMIPFAGYLMAVKYTDSITSSHVHTRKSCSLFDVSHMLQTKIYGKHKEQFMEQICVTDVQGESVSCYSSLALWGNHIYRSYSTRIEIGLNF